MKLGRTRLGRGHRDGAVAAVAIAAPASKLRAGCGDRRQCYGPAGRIGFGTVGPAIDTGGIADQRLCGAAIRRAPGSLHTERTFRQLYHGSTKSPFGAAGSPGASLFLQAPQGDQPGQPEGFRAPLLWFYERVPLSAFYLRRKFPLVAP